MVERGELGIVIAYGHPLSPEHQELRGGGV